MQALHLEFKKSQYFLGIEIFLHVGGLVCCWLASIPLWFKGLVSIAIILSVVLLGKFHPHQKIKRIYEIEENYWRIEHISGKLYDSFAYYPVLVTPLLVILRFKVENKRRTLPIVIFSDALQPEVFRRLRVKLRLQNP